MRSFVLSLFFSSSAILVSYCQIQISGRLKLDSTWVSTIYASEIPSLKDLYKSAEFLLIAKAPIETDGSFSLTLPKLSVDPTIVRLHVSKKGGPPAMLIIGGKEENHGFFAVSDRHKNSIIESGEGTLFQHYSGQDQNNIQLFSILQLVNHAEELRALEPSELEQRRLRDQLVDDLYHLADTTKLQLPAIFAMWQADMGYNSDDIHRKMQLIKRNLGSHPYLIPYTTNNTSQTHWIIGILFVALIAGVSFLIIVLGNRKLLNRKTLELSPQERKVAQLISNGKTNKEIADLLHVEVSTVKSHVYKIFHKLSIKSRKEVYRFRSFL